jgi:hypothetical protein
VTDHHFVEKRDAPLCDFCTTKRAVDWVWVLPPEVRGSTLAVAEGDESSAAIEANDTDGLWAACATCDRLIQEVRARPARMPALVVHALRRSGKVDDVGKTYIGALFGRIVPAFVERRPASDYEGQPSVFDAHGDQETIEALREIRERIDEEGE